ncbi:MAG: T9SS type A sorting domain-containing protein [Bacteroidetes bacterium]|nr:T9SS type A sorting domain-containing protein [Bacteroidota bacterium]
MAQTGSLDTTFGTGGKVITNFGPGSGGQINSLAMQSDGKIIASGSIKHDFGVIRYNANGTMDLSFGNGGKAIASMPGNVIDAAKKVLLQPDGKIILVGITYTSYDNDDILLVRFNSNGSLDSTFGNNGIVFTSFGSDNDRANSAVLLNDGKILVCGSAENASMYNELLLLRYNSNGTLDTTFNGTGYVKGLSTYGTASDIIQLQNGQFILMCGVLLVRFNPNGTLDNTFSQNGMVNSNSLGRIAIGIQSNGKIIVAGWREPEFGSADFAVLRFNPNGSLDSTFGTNGMSTFDFQRRDFCLSMTVQSNGKILLAGWSDSYGTYSKFVVVCFKEDGNVDAGFGVGGITTTDFGTFSQINSVIIQADGKILAGGERTYEIASSIFQTDFALARYNNENITGLKYNSKNIDEVHVFPNPSSGIFTIDFNNKNANTKICIYDVLGKCIWSKYCGNNVKAIADLSAQPQGIYFIEILSEGKKTVKKIIVN